jgi:hypothetical protein
MKEPRWLQKYIDSAQKYFSMVRISPTQEEIIEYVAGARADKLGIEFDQALEQVSPYFEEEVGEPEE